MSGFVIGDVVRLKSHSPKMTITGIDADEATCVWFDGSEPKYGEFKLAVLKKEDETRNQYGIE